MKNIVTIGGGTGSFTLLTGLKKYPVNISAVVSMADDGGSTGVLRDELGVLPPGDVRQCLVALSESSETLRELMNYRFEGGGLKGHSFGNLLLSALEKIKGNFAEGVEEAAKILDIKGEVIPVANKDVRLCVKLRNGEVLSGQSQMDHNEKVREIGIAEVFIKPRVSAYKKVLDRIKKADFIIIGPGDHYGSILPNLLVSGVGKSIKKSKAVVVYNCNLTNKKGQTDDFDLDCYVSEMEKFIGKGRIDFATYNIRRPNKRLLEKYEKREGKNSLVLLKKEKNNPGYRIIVADFLQNAKVVRKKGDAIFDTRSFIRHDSEKLARTLMKIIEPERY
ncbi:MAG: putative gluconeosis factor [Patescibacteria group bacterium]|nr:putative gluconeosis factor [Patescibacteria group bacterium]